MSSKRDETDLLHEWIALVPYILPNCRVFRRNVINLPSSVDGRSFRVRNGTIGQGDAYVLVEGGLHIEVEAKSARGTLRDRQEAWRDFCVGFGIPHLVIRARAGETTEETLARWCEELQALLNDRERHG